MKGGTMNAKLFRPVALAILLLVAVTIAATDVPRSAGAADAGWLGEYYANAWLMGPPAMIREDASISFDWGAGSPAPQLPPDNFSVRWTRTLTLDAGRYRFTTTTDDGVRLFLDGGLIIDQWHDQGPTAYSAERDLGAGQHSLRMEYYEASGNAVAQLAWTRVNPPPPVDAWRGEYFANPSLSGSPAMVRDDADINFDWGEGSPAPQIPPDNFSVRWTRSLTLDGGRYRFTTTTDDGVRLYLDGALIIDQWHDQSPTTYNAERDLGAGQHSLRMDYYEASGRAMARLAWARVNPPPPPPGAWRGEYFANPSLSGSPAIVRNDADINFDWGDGSPAPQIPPDNFSVRWTRSLTLDGGRYRFSTTTDDGVRLYLDGGLIIDQWHDQAPTTYNAERDLGAGQHSLRMEYYDASGRAMARLTWTVVNPSPPTVSPWRGEYFANPSLSGSPAMVRADTAISFDWGGGSPAPQIPPDNFSVRWTRSVTFDAGRYRFTTTTDDGVRLYVDDQLIIDQWHNQAPTAYSAERDLGAGQHLLRMDYYEATGNALARLAWARVNPAPPPSSPWRGEYFTNPWLSGTPALVRNDAAIDFNWGLGSPAPQIPPDNFSIRWTRTSAYSGGRYRFKTTTDDGVRLYVDGRLVINRWYDMAPTTFTVLLDLGAGKHTVRMEYYEHLGNAVAKLSVEKVGAKEDKPADVGNIVTCASPGNSWVRVYRLEGANWVDTNPKGYGPIGSSGRMKLDGFSVDVKRYGGAGQPYRVEVWTNGVRVRSTGDTAAGEAPFRVRAWADNYTPWGCP
jgi:hypothetical protein